MTSYFAPDGDLSSPISTGSVPSFGDITTQQSQVTKPIKRKNRSRPYQACERCRLKKIRCDPYRPCSACCSVGFRCILGSSQRVQTYVPYLEDKVKVLEDKVQLLEGQVQQLEAQVAGSEEQQMLVSIQAGGKAGATSTTNCTTDLNDDSINLDAEGCEISDMANSPKFDPFQFLPGNGRLVSQTTDFDLYPDLSQEVNNTSIARTASWHSGQPDQRSMLPSISQSTPLGWWEAHNSSWMDYFEN
ncbi:hypothetical protein B0T10DRAFT_463234 [Thelonectria olida]|uniref:Zn(2)-C6 fungal-type domain-containing protein n=1 Tax=Thelonectria olida TaxID=1576542 RepID=A0A9P8W045_9HYPO|nr:hypothetical protein B0T10DRAFT_463234 [Thelonectria olida]